MFRCDVVYNQKMEPLFKGKHEKVMEWMRNLHPDYPDDIWIWVRKEKRLMSQAEYANSKE